MKTLISGCSSVVITLLFSLGLGFQSIYGQSITTTSGSWFSASTWANGNPGTIVGTSTRVVNPVALDGTGGTLNLMSSGNINSIINAPITDNSTSGWSITFSNNGNNYLQINSTFYIKNNFDIAGGFPTTFAGNGYIGGTLSMQNNGGVSLRIKSGYSVTVGGLNNQGGIIYIEPGASLIILGNATVANNGTAGIITDGSLIVNGTLNVQGGSGITGTGTLTTPNPITIANNGGANVFGQTYSSTGGTIACSSVSSCNLSSNTVCSGITVNIGANQSICSGATPSSLSTIIGTAIIGTVTYQWVQYSASANGFQNVASGGTGATYTPGALTQQTFYKLKVTKAGCTTYSSAVTITVSSAAAISNANITGSTSICTGTTGLVYTVNGITGATSYNWTFPSGLVVITITGSFATVSVSGSAISGQISVSGVNSCGTSNAVALNVSVSSIPVAGAISGSTAVCNGQNPYKYSISPIANATSYTWTNTSSNVTLTGGINTTTVTSSVTGGAFTNFVLSVSGTNSCGTSPASTITVSINTTPTGTGSITNPANICQSATGLFTVSGFTNATAFTWTVSSGLNVSSGQGTSIAGITPSASATSETISVTSSNVCGTGNTISAVTTVNSVPAAPSAISGSNSFCFLGSSNVYSVPTVAGILSYVWTVPTGTLQYTVANPNNVNTVTVTSGLLSGSGTISVSAVNACGTGPAANISISIAVGTLSSGTIMGNTTICQGSMAVYTASGAVLATNYNWSVPSGFSMVSLNGTSSTLMTISVSGTTTGTISVIGSSGCGTASPATLGVNVTPLVAGSGPVLGSSSLCQNTGSTYTITGIANASSYNWSIPSGFSISSGQGTSVLGVTVSGTASTGSLSISGKNVCGSGNVVVQSVNVNSTPTGTGAITGTNPVCLGASYNYTVTGLTNASSFNWTVPSGFTISSGQGTSILTFSVAPSASGGNMSISGSNVCGSGLPGSQAISVVTLPSNPLTISGSLIVCQGQTSVIYNTTVTNASSYNWGLPTGASITGGTGTNSITVTYSSSAISGPLTVQGVNGACPGNTSSAYNVTVNSSVSSNTLTGFANTICWNTSPSTTLTGTAASGGIGNYTYLWETSTVSGTIGFGSATGTNTGSTYVPGTLTTTTWYKRIVSSGTCAPNTSSGVSINVVSLTGSWLGNNTDWNSSVNWCSGTVPSSVFIDAGRPNYPIITISGVSVTDLVISSGASLTINAPNIITIGGNFLNSGTFTASTGTGVIFNGSSTQSIAGTNTFYDISLVKSSIAAPVVLAGNTSLMGTLTLSANSELVTTGYSFLLVSNVSGTARIASIPSTSTIVGNITVQRYIPAKVAYRFLSSAVIGSSLNDWKGTMLITGNGSGSDAGSALPTVYQYNEPLAGNQNVGFQSITSGTSTPIQTGRGYRVFVRGDRSINLTTNYAANITTLSVSGAPTIGLVSMPVTYTSTTGGNVSTDGWNLVGNPYASQIDWNLVKAGGSNFQKIDDAIYILDPLSSTSSLAGQYLYYVGGVAAGPGSSNPNPNLISSSQAFFVHANAANPVLKLDENVKVGGTANNHFKSEEISNLLRISIEGTSGTDNTVIRFADGANDYFDSKFDAYKMLNSNASVSSNPITGLDLAINTMLPLDTTSKTVPLNFNTLINGDQKFRFDNLASFGTQTKIILVDKYLNTITEVNEGTTYLFATSTITGTKGNARFEVIFVPQFGSVKMSIGPDSLIQTNSSVKWSIDSVWYNNNGTANYIPSGTHTVSFATVPGWISPASQQITISTSTLTTLSGVYLPVPKIGSVSIKLFPESLDKGRIKTQWKLNNGSWQNSGATLDSLPEGAYTISFNDIRGWIKPQEINITIQNGQLTSTLGTFIQIPDTLANVTEEPKVIADTTEIKINKISDSTTVTKTSDKVVNKILEVNAYPDPVGDKSLTLNLDGVNEKDLIINIYSETGNVIFSKTYQVINIQNSSVITLDIFKSFSPGVYIIKLIQSDRIIVKKIIK